MFSDFPLITEYGIINTKHDCPFYYVRARTCRDGLYKKCAPQRCNRLLNKPKSRGYGVKGKRHK